MSDIIAIAAVAITIAGIWHVINRHEFNTNPVGKRCRVDTGEGLERGTVLEMSSLVLNEFIVRLDDGNYCVADLSEIKPIWWEL